jgi:hypothetical protein
MKEFTEGKCDEIISKETQHPSAACNLVDVPDAFCEVGLFVLEVTEEVELDIEVSLMTSDADEVEDDETADSDAADADC